MRKKTRGNREVVVNSHSNAQNSPISSVTARPFVCSEVKKKCGDFALKWSQLAEEKGGVNFANERCLSAKRLV